MRPRVPTGPHGCPARRCDRTGRPITRMRSASRMDDSRSAMTKLVRSERSAAMGLRHEHRGHVAQQSRPLILSACGVHIRRSTGAHTVIRARPRGTARFRGVPKASIRTRAYPLTDHRVAMAVGPIWAGRWWPRSPGKPRSMPATACVPRSRLAPAARRPGNRGMPCIGTGPSPASSGPFRTA